MFHRARQRTLKDDYRQTFSGEAGQRVLADLLRVCRVSHPTFAPGVPDMTAFNEGARSVGLRILKHLELDEREALQAEARFDGRRDDTHFDD
jgi:hypothetical protein